MHHLSRFATRLFVVAGLMLPTIAAAAPITYHAVIEVHSASDNSLVGYIAEDAGSTGQALYTATPGNALGVNFTLDGVTSATGIDLLVENYSVPGYGFLGLVQGRDDADSMLQAGSYQYAYIATTNQTPANSTPQIVGNSYQGTTPRTSESAVWNVDTVSGAIAPVWTNPDGTTPLLAMFSQSTGLYVGGDQGAFFARYPAGGFGYTLHLDIISQDAGPQPVPEPTSMMLLATGLIGLATRFRHKR